MIWVTRLDGERVHLLAGNAALVRGLLGEGAHGAAGVGVFETVREHVIKHLLVA